MPAPNPFLTTWNKNAQNGIAACLLDNWVEERAVAEEEGITPGTPIVAPVVPPSPHGHKPLSKNRVIFQHGKVDLDKTFKSTTQECYQPPTAGTRDEQGSPQRSYSPRKQLYGGPSALIGTRRSKIEMDLWERAKEETKVVEEEPSAKDWASSYKDNFFKEFDSNEAIFEDPELLNSLNEPITIWQEHRKNKLLYISSLRRDQAAEELSEETKFGRNVDFSTPTEQYLKGPVHE